MASIVSTIARLGLGALCNAIIMSTSIAATIPNYNAGMQAYKDAENTVKMMQHVGRGQHYNIQDSYREEASFYDLLTQKARNVKGTLNKADSKSKEAMVGKASMAETVFMLNEAKEELKMMSGMLQKGLGAYQDIIKLPL